MFHPIFRVLVHTFLRNMLCSLGVTQEEGRFKSPPSTCGACLGFYRELVLSVLSHSSTVKSKFTATHDTTPCPPPPPHVLFGNGAQKVGSIPGGLILQGPPYGLTPPRAEHFFRRSPLPGFSKNIECDRDLASLFILEVERAVFCTRITLTAFLSRTCPRAIPGEWMYNK